MAKPVPRLSFTDIAAVIQTAWDDPPPYHRVLMRHGLTPGQLVALLRRELTPAAYRAWLQRGCTASPAAPGRRRERR